MVMEFCTYGYLIRRLERNIGSLSVITMVYEPLSFTCVPVSYLTALQVNYIDGNLECLLTSQVLGLFI